MTSINSLKVNVTGVVPEKQTIADKELRTFFESVCFLDDIASIEIIISSDFQKIINIILQREREVTIHYNQIRSQVAAVGKTIPVFRENRIGFYIVFDGTLLGRWEKSDYPWRLTLFIHEATHVRDEVALFHEIGAEVFFSEPSTVDDMFNSLAYDVWMEYHAERWSIELFEKVIKETCPQVETNYALHRGYADSLNKSLIAFPGFLAEKVDEFQNWRMTMDDFWPLVYSRLRESLILAAFTSGQADATKRQYPEYSENERRQFYSFFLDKWREIEQRLQTLYNTEKQYDPATVNTIGISLKGVFESCGMAFRDIESGIYIEIRPFGWSIGS